MRARPTLKFTKFKDNQGRQIDSTQYPQKAAEYLENEQWKIDKVNLPPSKVNPSCLTQARTVPHQRWLATSRCKNWTKYSKNKQ